jgi:hypothetical protein
VYAHLRYASSTTTYAFTRRTFWPYASMSSSVYMCADPSVHRPFGDGPRHCLQRAPTNDPTNDRSCSEELHPCKLVTAVVLTSYVPCIPTHLRAHSLSAQSVTAFSERQQVHNELVRHGGVHRSHGWHSQECAAADKHVGCIGVLCDCYGHRRECCWVLLNAVAETRVQRPCIGQR